MILGNLIYPKDFKKLKQPPTQEWSQIKDLMQQLYQFSEKKFKKLVKQIPCFMTITQLFKLNVDKSLLEDFELLEEVMDSHNNSTTLE